MVDDDLYLLLAVTQDVGSLDVIIRCLTDVSFLISRSTETYVVPTGVIRLNPITVSGQYIVPGAKVPRAAFRR